MVFFGLLAIVAALGLMVLLAVRCILAIARAQREEAMPNPKSWLI